MNNNDIVPGFDDEKDERLKIRLQKVEEIHDALILELSGYIDTYNANYFRKRVAKAIEAGFIRLVFNLTHLTYLNESFPGFFVPVLKTVIPRGGDLIMINLDARIKELLQLLGLAKFFNIKENIQEAVSFLSQTGDGGLFLNIFNCPVCRKRLRAYKKGRFRCAECLTILEIDEVGRVSIG